jgi:ribonuclease HI
LPLHGILKCNVDASFFNNEGACGWGWCIRGSNGQFILAGSNILYEKLNIIEGEALAIREAMCEIIQRGFTQVIFESDSKVVVDAIHSRNVGVSEFCSIISSIQSLLLLYPNFEVKFVKRQANSVAHTLARAAYSKTSRYIYDLVPPGIHNILINEML